MSLLAAVKAQKAKEDAEAKKEAPAAEKPAADKKQGEAEAAPEAPPAEFGSIVKLLNMKKLQKQGAADLRPKKPKRRYSLPDSLEKIENLPFEPAMDPEWSPRGVAQDALDYLDRRAVEQAAEKETRRKEEEAEARGETYVPPSPSASPPKAALVPTNSTGSGLGGGGAMAPPFAFQGGDMSPTRKQCRDNLASEIMNMKPDISISMLQTKAVVHHVEIDPHKLKKARGDTTLHNVTTVTRRTQRALSAEEVALNCEKSINYFKMSKLVNAEIKQEKTRGGGWSKLRIKFMKK